MHEVLTSVIDAGPAEAPEAPELDWLGAKLLNAQVLALAGDRKGARGRVTKLITALEVSEKSPKADALLTQARAVAESTKYHPSV